MVVNVCGPTILIKAVHPWKALIPIAVRDVGNVALVILVHP